MPKPIKVFQDEEEECDDGNSMLCGSGFSCECDGAAIPFTDAGFQKYSSTLVNVLFGAINIGLQMTTGDLSTNLLYAINAVRCAGLSIFENSWYFTASAWWALSFLGMENLLEDFLSWSYPHLCTCLGDVNTIGRFFGGSDESAEIFSTCSESAANA